MTDEEIARLKGLCEKATPGPWRCDDVLIHQDDLPATYAISDEDEQSIAVLGQIQGIKGRQIIRNAEFIAAAREAIPALCDEVERLRGALECAVRAMDTVVEVFDFRDVETWGGLDYANGLIEAAEIACAALGVE